jgi:type II secretory pathway pseudopilin PulG
MRNDNQAGSISVVVAILSTLLLIAVSVFAFWVYGQMQDYKLHSDQKAAAAVSAAKTAQAAELKKQYDQEAKNPYKTYQGSPTYGSISFKYPKTWSAYIDETSPSQPINGYLHPDIVPGTTGLTAYALRVELVSASYTS